MKPEEENINLREKDKYIVLKSIELHKKGLKKAVLADCWHEVDETKPYVFYGNSIWWSCKNCGNKHTEKNHLKNPEFSTSDGFFKLFNWSKQNEWWEKFKSYIHGGYSGYTNNMCLNDKDINPVNFRDKIYDFLLEKEKKDREVLDNL